MNRTQGRVASSALHLCHALLFHALLCLAFVASAATSAQGDQAASAEELRFFEQKIRPLLIEHCYACHSEQAGERQGGLLLDRPSGWIEGGDTNKAVVPGEPQASLLITAIRYDDDDLQMPPDGRLDDAAILLLEQWVERGAHGPAVDPSETAFSRLGDQEVLFDQAEQHWSFQPVRPVTINKPNAAVAIRLGWDEQAIDGLVFQTMHAAGLTPSRSADSATLFRRLHYDLTGLPARFEQIIAFVESAKIDPDRAFQQAIDELIESPEYGKHLARLWLDVVRYADTDNDYRPDTRTPHYYPFAFSYRDYVVDALNADKPYDQFLKEQLAADLIGFQPGSSELAALGYYAAGPYAMRAQTEALDDWIDVTTRGLMGITVACARCHDHKFEPVPTADYYSLRGVFAAVTRVPPLDENDQPLIDTYRPSAADVDDYAAKRALIDAKINGAGDSKSKANNRSVAERIQETELAELLTFHPGAPARAMIVNERAKPPAAFIFVRGDASSRGAAVPRRFLKILDPEQSEFPSNSSGRLELAERIATNQNPLTARVFVNRIWGQLIGSHLVDTPSDFGLQGSRPTHPELLDWLADDFMRHDWSVKHLLRRIVSSRTYQQSSLARDDAQAIDPENHLLWRANRKHLSIEAIRDSLLAVAGQLDRRLGGHAEPLWDDGYTHRRAIYGFINRFNLDPTLGAFDFPSPIQTQPARGESIVAQQALFAMNAGFVIDQAAAITNDETFVRLGKDDQRLDHLFRAILGREPVKNETERALKLVEFQQRFQQPDRKPTRFIESPWPLLAQALMMSNEFQYVD